uniref:Hypotheticial protein n=1 Tax=Schistosoma japonicum TaxID=6182 RepID=C1LHB1_SCHJA|nr:hypotheticial protein [Schistosoma japonicum]
MKLLYYLHYSFSRFLFSILVDQSNSPVHDSIASYSSTSSPISIDIIFSPFKSDTIVFRSIY